MVVSVTKDTDPSRPDPDGKNTGVDRHVLPWTCPLARSAAEWLARDWPREGPLDLSDWLVIVPTRQSGRRLREALAILAAEAGQAVLSPRVVLPETLVAPDAGAVGVASRAQQMLAWIEVLQTVDLQAVRAVFPVDPASRSFTWARELAGQLMELQATLGESGLTIDSALRPMQTGAQAFPEIERWTQLAWLARMTGRLLRQHGLQIPSAAALACARDSALPAGVRRIALLATPDPLPLAVQALARHAERVRVSVVIHGPGDEPVGHLFDEWGRPHPEVWSQRHLDWPDFRQRIHLCADPADQADRIAALAGRSVGPPGDLGIGISDTEVLPVLQQSLASAGIAAYNPAGRAWRLEGFHALLACLAEFARSASWDAVRALLRCPDVLTWLQSAGPATISGSGILRDVDALGEEHLPPTLAEALRHATAAGGPAGRFTSAFAVLARLDALQRMLVAGRFPENAVGALQEVFSGRKVESGTLLFEAIEVWTGTLRDAGAALAAFRQSRCGLGEAWEFALSLFGERMRFEEKAEGALELKGWLELLWEDAPHLVIAGMNDGCVPEAIVGDAFLPEAARMALGLKTNAMRFARDAYLLHALAASRRGAAGRLDLLVGKVSNTGDPLRPSRLLLRCPDGELPDRVAWLFRGVDTAEASVPWTRAWLLKPKRVDPPKRVSVTALRDWLECPFRFYLKHALGMRRVELEKSELDPRDFGNLMHGTLQHLADREAKDLIDAGDLRNFLLAHFERSVRDRYGELLTLPLVIQFESARQRLRRAAEIEAEQRALGWRTERVEWKFELPLGGVLIRGVIDRLDRNLNHPGRVRVLDYKTSDKAATPASAHLRAIRSVDADRDPWQRAFPGDKEHVWTDLQLPVYRRVLAAEWGDDIACGYFNLPKAIGESAVSLWEDFTPGLQRSADACLEGVVAAVAAGRFWPPAETVRRGEDAWAELFHHGAADSIDPAAAGWLAGGTRNPGGES